MLDPQSTMGHNQTAEHPLVTSHRGRNITSTRPRFFTRFKKAMPVNRFLLATIVSQCIAAAVPLSADEPQRANSTSNGAETATSADDPATLPADAIKLFNGKDLAGWVVEGTKENKRSGESKPVWSARAGLIHCEGTGFGFLRYDRKFCDFTIHVEFRLTKGCNSGIGIRHAKYTGKSETRPSYSGYEIQLLDDGGKQPNKGSTASLYRYVAPKSLPVKQPGEWNTIEIECRGPRIQVTLNGQLGQDVDQSAIDEIKSKPLCGFVSVQNHGKTIDFRNLWIQEHEATKK